MATTLTLDPLEELRRAHPKRARFVEEYLVDLNGRQAAIRAGYAENSADVTASRLLADARVQVAIQAAVKARSERTQITQDRVLKELARIAFADVRRVMSWDRDTAAFVPSDLLDADTSAAIQSVRSKRTVVRVDGGEVTEDHILEVKLHPKTEALKLLAEHVGLTGSISPVQIQKRLTRMIQVIHEALPQEQAEALIRRLEPVWQ